MSKAKINRINKFQYTPETTCRIFVLLMSTLYILSIPFDGYTVIANWKYHAFLTLYCGFIIVVIVVVEQKLVSDKKATGNRRGLDIFSLSLLSYFLITCLSGLVSQYSGTFLGNGRHEGLLAIGLYVISTLLLVRYLRVKKWMLFAFGATITVFCILGIVQLTGANPFCLYPMNMNFYDAGRNYVGQYWATIGNTNLCAALLSTAVGTFAAMSVRVGKKTDWIALAPLTLSVFCIVELNSEYCLCFGYTSHQHNNLIAKIYEDRVNEKINERTFSMLSQKYQQEQGELETRIEVLTAQLASAKEQEDGIKKWIDLVKQFSTPTELTAEMLNTLIEKSLVHEATKDADGKRTQEIEIFTASSVRLTNIINYMSPAVRICPAAPQKLLFSFEKDGFCYFPAHFRMT